MRIDTSISYLAILLYTPAVISQEKFSISSSLNAFSIDLLKTTNALGGDQLNLALSPYTIWTLLTVISEGALDDTAKQLESVLRIPPNKAAVRNQFKNLSSILLGKSPGIALDLSSNFFTNKNFQVKEQFSTSSKRYYSIDILPVNFSSPKTASQTVNKHVALVTKNRIQQIVSPDDVKNAQVFLTSVLFFKGQWQSPFNKSATQKDDFFNSERKKIGEVDMMFQTGIFPFSKMDSIRSYTIELPYGDDKKMSMIVVLPLKGESVTSVLNLMSKVPFVNILQNLEDAGMEYIDEETNVYLPKFSISSDFNLDGVLNKMGLFDIFDPQKANLLGIFYHYLHLSRLIQKAEIEVTEEGTVASAAAGASFSYKAPPPKFRANKPFLYFIVDKPTKSILFAGKVSNPNTLGK